jgi:putative glutamine amidotransferase
MEARPRIGITCSPLRVEGYYDPYLRAIEAAGADPVVIAPMPIQPSRADAEQLLADIDGLIVPGGWDVSPEQYGGTRVTEMTQLDRALDQTEVALVRGAADSAMPVLGICRGQQLINVALGGTLLQHIDGHDIQGHPRNRLAHVIDVDPNSDLAHVVSERLMVNSMHHQAVKDLAPGLRATAHSPDGIIEALESSDGLIVAVQSHPEELVEEESWARALFARFIDRSKHRHARSRGTRATPAET